MIPPAALLAILVCRRAERERGRSITIT